MKKMFFLLCILFAFSACKENNNMKDNILLSGFAPEKIVGKTIRTTYQELNFTSTNVVSWSNSNVGNGDAGTGIGNYSYEKTSANVAKLKITNCKIDYKDGNFLIIEDFNVILDFVSDYKGQCIGDWSYHHECTNCSYEQTNSNIENTHHSNFRAMFIIL